MSTTLEEILVALETGEGVATITLDRPQKFNALNSAMIQQFNEALDTVAEDPDVRAVVVSGTGKAFAAGADIAQYEKAEAAQFAAFTQIGRAHV